MTAVTMTHDLATPSPSYSVADHATETLRGIVGPNDPRQVHAHWTYAPAAADGATLCLRLNDPVAEVVTVFRPDDLTGPNEWFSLSRAYRRLLSGRVHRLLDQLGPPPGAGANG